MTEEIMAVTPLVMMAEPAKPQGVGTRTRFPLWTGFVLLASLLISAAGATYLTVRWRSAEASTPAVLPEGEEIRILAGALEAPLTDQLGRSWQPDRYFTRGWVSTSPGHVADGTRDSNVYQNYREGDFQYDIPLKPGIYELHLHFAETVYREHNPGGGGETSRLFNVDLNDTRVLDYFDVISDAHGASIADEGVF
jgi:hypothetical protein